MHRQRPAKKKSGTRKYAYESSRPSESEGMADFRRHAGEETVVEVGVDREALVAEEQRDFTRLTNDTKVREETSTYPGQYFHREEVKGKEEGGGLLLVLALDLEPL